MTDLNLGGTVTAGGYGTGGVFANPGNANDGSDATAATRGGATPPFLSYLESDLGSDHFIGRCELLEGSNTGFNYNVQWSTDAVTWHDAGATRSYLGGNRQRYSFAPVLARYFRLQDGPIPSGGVHPALAWKTWTIEPAAPVADFSGIPLSGAVPLTVDFTDLSVGGVTDWLWDFGDGDTSTDQNPSHEYDAVGIYTVTLTVTSPDGEDTETKVAYVLVGTPDPVGWDAFAAAEPNGPLLAILQDDAGPVEGATGRAIRIERDGPGSGQFKINRYSPVALEAVLADGNIVKCRFPWRDDYDFAFLLETGDFTLAHADERGGEEFTFKGRGVLAYLDRAVMDAAAYTTGLDLSDTWTEIWAASVTWRPTGTAFLAATPGYVFAIGEFTRRIYKIDQATQKVVATSPVLWAGSTKLAGGLSADPADPNVMWALEAPWFGGYAGNTKIRKIDISGAISTWAVSATIDLGSAIKHTAIKADATHLWLSRYDGTASVYKRLKTTGANAAGSPFTVAYGGVNQSKAVGISVNGTGLAYWYAGTKRALIADSAAPATVTDKISTGSISAFGGDWSTEAGQDYFYMDSYTAGKVWKYQITAATPHDPVDGIWRLDEGTPGAILWRTIQEAQAAGRPQQPIPDVSYGFTDALDSNGDAWDTHDGTLEFDAQIGDSLLATDLRLIPYGLVERMSPYLVLGGYNASTYGVDRTGAFGAGVVRLEKGVNIIPELGRQARERPLHSHLLATGSGSLYARATLADLGYVREGFISTDLQDETALEGTAEAVLDDERVKRERIRLAVPIGDDEEAGLYLPFTHYNVGDLVTLHTGSGEHDFDEETLLLYAMSLVEGPAGTFEQAILELGSATLVQPPTGATSGGGSSGSTGGTTIRTSSQLAGGDGADIVIPNVTTLEAPGAYSPAPGVMVIPIPDAIAPLAEELVTDETDTTKRLAPDGLGGAEFRQVDVDELATSELDTTLVARPDGAGGVVFDAEGGGGLPWFNIRDYGALQDGATDDTLAVQAAIDACTAAGGGIVYVPASASATLISAEASGERYGITLKTGVLLQGDGKKVSVFEFDPGQTLPAGDVFIPIEIGTDSAGVTDVGIRDVGLIANHSILGTGTGPYIEGIAARQDGDETEHCDNVAIERVWVSDANTTIYCCKDGALSGATKIADQHRNWAVRDSLIEDADNKAIEMQQVDGFIVTGNVGVRCTDGLQAINYSQHGVVQGNVVEYRAAGLSFTEGVADISAQGNVFNCIGGAGTFVGGLIFRREPFTGSITAGKRIVVQGNVFRDWTSSEKIGLLFASFAPNTGVGTFEDLEILDNIFDAETSYLYDPYYPAKTAATRLRIEGNYFANVVNSSSSWSSSGTRLARNYIGANFTMASTGWALRLNTFGGTFTLTGTSCTLDDGYVRNVLVSATPPTAGQVLTATSATAADWETPSTSPTGAAGGDLSGTYPDPTVAKVNGVAVTGVPAAGDEIVATGPTTATWQTPATPGASVDHAHVADERHLSDGASTTYTLDQAFLDGSVTAMNITTLAWLGVTETAPDQVAVSAAGAAGDVIEFTYAAAAA